jgi:hypothetical protein
MNLALEYMYTDSGFVQVGRWYLNHGLYFASTLSNCAFTIRHKTSTTLRTTDREQEFFIQHEFSPRIHVLVPWQCPDTARAPVPYDHNVSDPCSLSVVLKVVDCILDTDSGFVQVGRWYLNHGLCPVPPVESDIRIGEQGLREIGTWVWGGQSYVEL